MPDARHLPADHTPPTSHGTTSTRTAPTADAAGREPAAREARPTEPMIDPAAATPTPPDASDAAARKQLDQAKAAVENVSQGYGGKDKKL